MELYFSCLFSVFLPCDSVADSFFFVVSPACVSSALKELTLGKLMDEGPNAAAFLLGIGHDGGDLFAVAERNIAPHAIDRELAGKILEQPSAVSSDHGTKGGGRLAITPGLKLPKLKAGRAAGAFGFSPKNCQ